MSPLPAMSDEVDSLQQLLGKNPSDVELLRRLGHLGLSHRNDTLAERCALKLMEIGSRNDPYGEAETYGTNLLAQVNIRRGNSSEGYKYLLKARRLAEMRRDSVSLETIFNGLAIYTYSEAGDIPGAIYYYHKGIAAAKAAKDDDFRHLLMNNIANAYLELGDEEGIKYAQECYAYAQSVDNHWLMFISALCQADYYHTFSDETRAFVYVNRAEVQLPFLQNVNLCELYTLKGKIFSAIHNYDRAHQNFMLAKEHSNSRLGQYLNVLNCEAEFEAKRGNYALAQTLLDSILMLSVDNSNNHARLPALLNYSELKERQGDIGKSLQYLKMHSRLKDSVNRYTNSQLMVDAQERYKSEELMNTLSQQRLKTMRHQRNFYIALSLLVVFLILVATILYWNYKQRRINRAIVLQIKNAQKTEDSLRTRISILEGRGRQTGSESVNQTLHKIMEDVEVLMKESRVYRDPNLTRDSLADAVGTNPTYLTKAIMCNYNLNFTQYVNSFRIKEAEQILSDTEDDTPIKNIGALVGFNSPTSFYNNFKESTGMTPAAYREALRR